jgi:ABC-2 type transport system permease protein
MFHLVAKDFYINRKYFLLVILIAGLISGTMFYESKISGVVFPLVIICYGMLTRSCYYDDKDRGDIFLRMMPIKPATIVSSKYVFGLLVIVMGFFPYMAIAFLGKPLGLELNIEYGAMAISVFIISFAHSIYLPVFFKYGYMKARTFQTVFYIGIMIVSLSLKSLIETIKLSVPISQGQWLIKPLSNMINVFSKNSVMLSLMCILISFIMLAVSAIISVRLYQTAR